MDVRLQNIGIISDSTITINGLTVVTGHNNSGKTTVGKVIYSLVDAVSNIEEKAINDKFSYGEEQIRDASKEFSFSKYLRRRYASIDNICLRIFFSNNPGSYIGRLGMENYLNDLLHEIRLFSFEEEPYRSIIEHEKKRFFYSDEKYDFDDFLVEKERCINILEKAICEITKDSELVSYAKKSISEMLSVEFSGQVQPVALNNVFSYIEIDEGKKKCFSIELFDNQIVESVKPAFFWMPYENALFIDNPFIIGDSGYKEVLRYASAKKTYINELHVMGHEEKLKRLVNHPSKKSIFKSGIIEERYKKINEKIDSILPGNFLFTSEGQYYVYENVKLKSSNLATGSKMFSIIKLLLLSGEITEKTLLILDEPEAHLHPKWQNLFAEIMILLVKELGCHILLTTHSPNFMLALEANMRKYNAMDVCNFYQTKPVDNTMFVNYKCVNESLEDIYEDFVTYLSEVKSLRDKYWG